MIYLLLVLIFIKEILNVVVNTNHAIALSILAYTGLNTTIPISQYSYERPLTRTSRAMVRVWSQIVSRPFFSIIQILLKPKWVQPSVKKSLPIDTRMSSPVMHYLFAQPCFLQHFISPRELHMLHFKCRGFCRLERFRAMCSFHFFAASCLTSVSLDFRCGKYRCAIVLALSMGFVEMRPTWWSCISLKCADDIA